MSHCAFYIGEACVSQSCPMELGEVESCEDCYAYKGCTDCILADTEACPSIRPL